MYVHMYVSMNVCKQLDSSTYTHIHTCTCRIVQICRIIMATYLCAYARVCTPSHMYICMYVCFYICVVYNNSCVFIQPYMHSYVYYIYIYIHRYRFVCIKFQFNISTHIKTDTQTDSYSFINRCAMHIIYICTYA